jgi:hypothetical protein
MKLVGISLVAMLGATLALAQTVSDAPGAKLRVLDKLTGEITDMTLAAGAESAVGRLTVALEACRYYPDNPAAEAFAQLKILDSSVKDPVFDGWMTASSPALSALDHPRYDVWVLRCDVPDLVLPEVAEPDPEADPAAVDPDADPAATDGGNG